MSITLDYNNMMSEFIQHGITQHRLQDFADMARCAHGAVEANRGKGMQEWMLSPYIKSKDIKRILEVAAKALQLHGGYGYMKDYRKPKFSTISKRLISFPSLSVPIGSYKETSLVSLRSLRSIMRSSFSMHRAA